MHTRAHTQKAEKTVFTACYYQK